MSVVLDASVAVDAVVDAGARGKWCPEYVGSGRGLVPDLIYPEATRALRCVEMKGLFGVEANVEKLLGFTWVSMRFETYAQAVWPLRHDISLYDACYVALAQVTEVPLTTLDRRLAATARRYCEVVTPDV